MKIALYHHLPCGGALLHLASVAGALQEAGHVIELFVPASAERGFTDLEERVDRVHAFPRRLFDPEAGPRWIRPLRYRQHLREMIASDLEVAEAIRRGGFDGLYSGQCRVWTEPPLLSLLAGELPVVHYCQEPKRSFHERRFLDEIAAWPWWKKAWRLPTIRWMKARQQAHILAAGRVLCNSEFSRGRIAEAYPGLEPEVSRIGVDLDSFSPSGDPAEEVLLSVGALDVSKGHELALRVAAARPGGKSFRVEVIGDREHGGEESKLRRVADELDVSLEVRRKVPLDELIHAYRRATCLVYAPREEPFGLAAIEAQACGRPVLGRAEGGILETVSEGEGGHLLPAGKEEATAASLLEGWVRDPGTYAQACRRARQKMEEEWDRRSCLAETVRQVEDAFAAGPGRA